MRSNQLIYLAIALKASAKITVFSVPANFYANFYSQISYLPLFQTPIRK